MTSWKDKYDVCSPSTSYVKDETSVDELIQVLLQTEPLFHPLPGHEYKTASARERHLASVDCDEVYPGVFIGDAASAMDRQYLKRIGITHVLNTAEGCHLGMVSTGADYYRGTGIKYMGIRLQDLPAANIGVHFAATANFIGDALRSGGKVLVHCFMGMSRSSTCVLSYLMLKEGFTARNALKRVRLCRDIRPNDGFLQQLADLDNRLRRDRLRLRTRVY